MPDKERNPPRRSAPTLPKQEGGREVDREFDLLDESFFSRRPNCTTAFPLTLPFREGEWEATGWVPTLAYICPGRDSNPHKVALGGFYLPLPLSRPALPKKLLMQHRSWSGLSLRHAIRTNTNGLSGSCTVSTLGGLSSA